MMCFRDMTFCSSDCVRITCFRHYGPDDREAARKWWGDDENGPPVAFGDFSKDCPDYIREALDNED